MQRSTKKGVRIQGFRLVVGRSDFKKIMQSLESVVRVFELFVAVLFEASRAVLMFG